MYVWGTVPPLILTKQYHSFFHSPSASRARTDQPACRAGTSGEAGKAGGCRGTGLRCCVPAWRKWSSVPSHSLGVGKEKTQELFFTSHRSQQGYACSWEKSHSRPSWDFSSLSLACPPVSTYASHGKKKKKETKNIISRVVVVPRKL